MPVNIKLIAVLWFGAILSIRAQDPKINFIEPCAISPAKTTRIILHGDNLETNWSLWTSFPVESKGDEITLGSDATAGIGAIRVVTAKGVSSFHLLMIDDLPTIKESSSNQTVATAQEIKPPVAIDGACNDLAFDYFSFNAKKGQEFSIEAVAQRLGSEADTVIRIVDEKAHEYMFCDDGRGVGRDSRLIFKAPAAGKYILEVRDINYQGGNQYRYRLRIGSFPLLTVPYPPVIAAGRTSEIAIPGSKPLKLCAAQEAAARIPFAVRGKAGSGFASVLVSDLDEALEQEPNDSLDHASTLRQSVCGRFERPKDRDLFRFEAEKDQRLVIAAKTRSLGSACDVLLNILKSDGSKLVEANVTGADEGTITNTFKESGTYFAEVQELTESARADFVYRLTISSLEPGFELSTEQDKCDAKDAQFTLKVSCTRRQYDGPITLSVSESERLTLEDNVISEKKNETVLKLKPKDDLPRGKLIHLRVSGEAKIGETTVRSFVSTQPALRKLFPKLPMLPAELDGMVALLVPEPGPQTKN